MKSRFRFAYAFSSKGIVQSMCFGFYYIFHPLAIVFSIYRKSISATPFDFCGFEYIKK